MEMNLYPGAPSGVAFTLVSGARDNAIASFSLKHIDLAARTVFQDAREVRTKNAKTFASTFFPGGGDIEVIIAEWIGELAAQGFGPRCINPGHQDCTGCQPSLRGCGAGT